MDLAEAVAARRSVRAYQADAEVDDATVEALLRLATRAPSGGNCQPWRFIVVRQAALRAELQEAAYGQPFVTEAPVVVVVCADLERNATRYGPRGTGLYCLQDTAAAVMLLMLGAVEVGLGTCWVGAFDEVAAREVLGLPDHLRPVALVPLGRPADQPAGPTSRRELSDVMEWRR